MSIQDEGQLRVRLGSALDEIEPGPAPLAAVFRRGTVIRRRHRAAVAGGIAMIAAGAVLAPALLDGQQTGRDSVPSGTLPHYSVKVSPPAKGAKPGVIATGSINGWHWQATLSGAGGNVGASFNGFGRMGSVSAAPPQAGEYASFDDSSDNAGRYAYVGPVAKAVRYLTVELSNGQTLTLHPQWWAGQRYVAMVLPSRLEAENAIAYGASGELGYAIPFNYGGSATFVTWLRPGQQGPAAAGTDVGSGGTGRDRWLVMAWIGPWGLCERVHEPDGGGVDGSCESAGGVSESGLVWGDMSSGVGAPELGQAKADVAYVLVTRSDGSAVRIRAVHLAGYRYGLLAMIRPAKSVVRSWTAYDAVGARLGSGTGDPLELR
jgi:hypothetical protein